MNIIKYVNHKLLCPQRDPQPSLMSLDLLGPTGRSYPGFYEVTAFAAVSAHMRLCVHPSTEESLFSPVLWNSWYQVPLAFKAKWCGVSSWCQTAIRSLMLSSETSLLWGNLCNIIIFQFVGCPPGWYGVWLYCNSSLPTYLFLCVYVCVCFVVRTYQKRYSTSCLFLLIVYWPRRAIPHWRSETAAVRRYPLSKVRSSSYALLEQPWRDTSHPR